MHSHRVAHLDLSIRNFLTDYRGHYACIDYELSRRYDGARAPPRVLGPRRSEVPPELERGEASDPFKVDVYGLAMTVLRAIDVSPAPSRVRLGGRLFIASRLQLTGYDVPELGALVRPALCETHEDRPTAAQMLDAFDAMVRGVHPSRLVKPPDLRC